MLSSSLNSKMQIGQVSPTSYSLGLLLNWAAFRSKSLILRLASCLLASLLLETQMAQMKRQIPQEIHQQIPKLRKASNRSIRWPNHKNVALLRQSFLPLKKLERTIQCQSKLLKFSSWVRDFYLQRVTSHSPPINRFAV